MRKSALEPKVIRELLDDRGHSNREINERLGRSDSERGNLQGQILEPLLDDKIIYYGPSRDTSKFQSKHPKQPERPFYLSKIVDVIKYIIQLIGDLEKQSQNGFWDEVFISNYMNNLIKELGFEEVYSLVEVYLKDMDFNRMASRTLLSRPAVNEE
jgi:hypothetical protein